MKNKKKKEKIFYLYVNMSKIESIYNKFNEINNSIIDTRNKLNELRKRKKKYTDHFIKYLNKNKKKQFKIQNNQLSSKTTKIKSCVSNKLIINTLTEYFINNLKITNSSKAKLLVNNFMKKLDKSRKITFKEEIVVKKI